MYGRSTAAPQTPRLIRKNKTDLPSFLEPQPLYSRPSLFCATTNPLGVGSNTTEISPSLSIFFAASLTVFTAELASCIKINP